MEQARKYFEARIIRDNLKDELSKAQEALDECEKNLVLFMEANNLQNFKDAENGMVYLMEKMYSRIENEDIAFEWLKNNGLGDAIKQTIHSKTLSAIAKEMFEKDQQEIPGVVSTFETKVGFRKSL